MDTTIFIHFFFSEGKNATTSAPKDENKEEKLLRLKRELILKTELSSAADENENLAIEEVNANFN